MADLQEHEASQTGLSFESQNASKKIPAGHLLVSNPGFFSFPHRNKKIHKKYYFIKLFEVIMLLSPFQTEKSENGPKEADGQCQHNYWYGKGNKSTTF